MTYRNLSFDVDQEFALVLINNITTILSILGIIYFFWLYKKIEIKSLSTTIVANIMLTDFVYSIANLLSNINDEHNTCVFEGFAREFSQLAALFWATMLAYSAFAQAVLRIPDLQNKLKTMMIIGYVIPFLISIVPFFSFSELEYSKMGLVCWITSSDDESGIPLYANIFFISGHIIIAIILVTYWYCRIYSFVRQASYQLVSANKLFLYPLILLISYFPVIIDRFLSSTELMFISAVIHTATQHLNGFLNAITYGIQTAGSALKVQKTQIPQDRASSLGISSYDGRRPENDSENHENFEDDDFSEMSLRKELLMASKD